MILQALVKYYENLAEQGKVSRLEWCHAKVSYEINLSSEGDIIGITSRKIEDMRGKKAVWVPANLVVPEMVTRSSGVAAISCAIIPSTCWALMQKGRIRV